MSFFGALRMSFRSVAIAVALLLATPTLAQTPPAERQITVSSIPGIVAPGAQWKMVWSGTDDADGIVGTSDGGVIFAQRAVSRVRKLDPDGKTSVLVENTDAAGSLAVDDQGQIIAVLRDHPSVAVLTPEHKLITDNYYGARFKGAADLVVEKRGGLYVTESQRTPWPGVYYIAPDGKMFSFGDGMRANGIALSPDEKTLYVSNRDNIVIIELRPDGTGSNNRHESEKLRGQGVNGDGMTVDAAGRVYVSTQTGVQILSPDGKFIGEIPSPRIVTSVAFSGPDKKALFIITRGSKGADGAESKLPTARTIYAIPTLAQGYLGRAK
jgi:gluconolactonase